MRVGVIGAGHWGKNLIKTLDKLGALAAIAEPIEATRAKFLEIYPQVTFYDTYETMLTTEVEAVAIATPAYTHYQIAKAALLAGKDVFLEKPMTLGSREAEDLVRLAEERDRILMVGHLLLYQSALNWVKNYLSDGLLGKIFSLHQERMDLGRAQAVENVLWSLGVHDLAVLLYLIGEKPIELTICGQRALQPGVEDDVYLHLLFPEGIRAHLHNSWLWPEKRRRLTIIGSKGMLVYDELQQTVVLHDKGINGDLTNRDNGEKLVFKGDGEPLTRELEHFLACVETRKKPISDGRNGLEVIRILEQASELLAKFETGI
ncbi:MAG: Gfo/Idh/MocA family oxidoreductase [Firmicutes bacterium]|nr:Gfo/Idh/MocA family oxidoreductase [Bacillota bacterium]